MAEHQHIIQVWDTNFIPQVTQVSFHVALKGSQRIGEAKWDPDPFIEPSGCNECSTGSASLAHEALVICLSLVQHCEPGIASKVFQNFLYSGDWMTIRQCFPIQLSVIYAQT